MKYLLGILLLIFTACGGDRNIETKKDEVLKVALANKPRSFDPQKNTDSSTLAVTKQIYNNLFSLGENGEITLEECAAISGKIDEDVDKLIEQRFFLEVSSPGIERPLKKIEDFIRFKGEKIKVSLKHKINDKKSFEGIITECKDNIIFLEIEEENIVEIPFSEVKKANIIYEFDEI